MPEAAISKVGWTTVAFGDVVEQVKDRIDPQQSGLQRYIAGEHMDTDNLRIRRWGDIGNDYLGPAFHMRFKPGHVLYGSRRTYLRKVAVAHFEGITANTTYVLESKHPDVLLPELLPFIMQTESFHSHSKRESKGSVNPYVNFSDLAWYEFSLPPLEEQRRILEVLQAVRLTNESLQDAMISLEGAEESVFKSLLSGNGTTQCEKRQHATFGLMPVDWPVMSMSDVADVAYGISAAVAKNKDPGIGWPILTGANISLGGFLETSKLVYHPEPTKPAFILKRGDVLLNWRSGSKAHVGKAALFELDGNWTYASFILRVRAGEGLNNLYLWRLLNYMRKNELFGRSTTQQVNFKMNAAYFREVEIPVPPKKTQDRIVDCMQRFWTSRTSIEDRLGRTQQLGQAILGELEAAK